MYFTWMHFQYVVLSVLGRNLMPEIRFSVLEHVLSFCRSTYGSVSITGLGRCFTYDGISLIYYLWEEERLSAWVHKTQNKVALGSWNIIQKLFP